MDAKKFAELYPNFNECTIQTFDDDQGKRLDLCKKMPIKGIDKTLVQKLNNEGAGIFFSVNAMVEGERNKQSVKKLNTWIVESDSLTKEEQDTLIENAPIPPSAIVESKKSYHIYYFASDATLENWERINRGLREYYDGDGKICSDTARVLRMPGFYHKKDPNNPYKITVKKIEPIYYKEEEMLKAFPYDVIEKKPQEHKKPNITKAKNIWEIMQLQSNRYMLQRVSNSMLVNGESVDFKKNTNGTEQIYVNGQSTSAWLDKNDMIGSSEGGPTWIQRCTYYGNSKSTIYKRFLEYCNDLIPKDFDRTKQLKELDKIQTQENEEAIEKERNKNFKHISQKDKILNSLDELLETSPDKIMKRGRKERDSYLGGIYGGKIYLIGADTGAGKSTFVNQVARNLASAGVKVARYSLEDRLEDIGKEDIYYTTNQIRVKKGKNKIEWIKFVNGEYTWKSSANYSSEICEDIAEAVEMLCSIQITELDKNKSVSIDDLIRLMHEECDKGTKVFIIDHLHYFQYENTKERMDLQIENAMKEINEVARKRDVAIFLVAHYNSTGINGNATLNSFKGSTGIKQIANIIIQITRSDDYDELTTFAISKLRGPIKKHEIEAKFDISTYTYTFTKTEEQIQKETKTRIT